MKKAEVKTYSRRLKYSVAEEILDREDSKLIGQLPDIILKNCRYAVTYQGNIYENHKITTRKHLLLFSKSFEEISYSIDLTMRAEPLELKFKPNKFETKIITVKNVPLKSSVRLFRGEDMNLYSDLSKLPKMTNTALDSEGYNTSLKVTAHEVYFDFEKIRFKDSAKREVSDNESWGMQYKIMLETGYRELRARLKVYGDKLINKATDGDICCSNMF